MNTNQNHLPQPVRGDDGASIMGPRNVPLEREDPDLLAAPGTDSGTVANLKFSFAAAHNRLLAGGWAREVTVRELPIATELAGVNMRLKPGAIRELHWHKEAEWAYMLTGSARIAAIDAQGRSFIDDVAQGDLWYFPAGLPHSIQALKDGCEFLLVFDNGNFSENETFLITDWFKHTEPAVLAQNFGVPAAAFAELPVDIEHERYIFPGPMPGPIGPDTDAVSSPEGEVPEPFSHRLPAQQPLTTAGGRVRIVDSTNFPAAKTIAAALVEVEPGGLRELHWHPNTDEWQYYISGQARMTVFASGGKARTFDYQAGDIGYVPFAMGHYVQNTGTQPLRFLEIFRSDHYADVSLTQWMALTPPALLKAHLNIDQRTIGALKKDKPVIVPATRRHAELPVLPEWPAMTIAVLSTFDRTPYAIPVTAPVRTGDRRIMFALRHERGSLARLLDNPQVALFIGGEHDQAFTARGSAHIAAEHMPAAPGWVAVALEVEEIDDHRQKAEHVESGIGVEWSDESAHEQLRKRVDLLRELGRAL